jgi:hypothetical protein
VKCLACRGPISVTRNRSGYCQVCSRANRCRGCGILQIGHGKNRCAECLHRSRIIQHLRTLPHFRPPAEELPWLLEHYGRRASAKLPLFDREALLEAVS